ncbi:MAG: hypothetical protein EKK53_13680 [Burkholderiales bacterium]|nr:MAG: hypothetical protein EKK53_13680 [Burkholderiales bacterium]
MTELDSGRPEGAATWRRSRRIHVVAALVSLLAAGSVVWLFDTFGIVRPSDAVERQLVASVDLRIGDPTAVGQQGEARARADIAAGLLQWQTFAKQPRDADAEAERAQRLKARYGLAWVYKTTEPTPLALAFVSGYNRVMQAEFERRHGKAALDELLRDPRARLPQKDTAS